MNYEILPLTLVALYKPVGRDILILLVSSVNAVTKSRKKALGNDVTSEIQKAAWFDQINTNQSRSVQYVILNLKTLRGVNFRDPLFIVIDISHYHLAARLKIPKIRFW